MQHAHVNIFYGPLIQPLRELEVLFLGHKQLVVVLRLARLRLLQLGTGCKIGLRLACGCGEKNRPTSDKYRKTGDRCTVVVAQEEPEKSVETKPVEDVPGERGDPSYIHVRRVNTALEHLLEAKSKWEGKFD